MEPAYTELELDAAKAVQAVQQTNLLQKAMDFQTPMEFEGTWSEEANTESKVDIN